MSGIFVENEVKDAAYQRRAVTPKETSETALKTSANALRTQADSSYPYSQVQWSLLLASHLSPEPSCCFWNFHTVPYSLVLTGDVA